MLTRPYASLIRDWRRDALALAPRGSPPPPARTLYCYSPSLVPTPRDWPADAVATGYWFRDGAAEESPDSELERFVREGTPPVYVGFGQCRARTCPWARPWPPPCRRQVAVRWSQRDGEGSAICMPAPTPWWSSGYHTGGCFPRCRGRASRRRGHHSRGAARRAPDDRAPVPGRSAFLGSGGPPRPRGSRAGAGEEAGRRAAGGGDRASSATPRCNDARPSCHRRSGGRTAWDGRPSRSRRR